jgi:hypothetical protein
MLCYSEFSTSLITNSNKIKTQHAPISVYSTRPREHVLPENNKGGYKTCTTGFLPLFKDLVEVMITFFTSLLFGKLWGSISVASETRSMIQ